MKNRNSPPPSFPFKLLHWFCPEALYEGIEGDLSEQFALDLKAKGNGYAKRRLLWNVIRFFHPEIILRNQFTKRFMNTMMIGNYFKVTFRSMQRRKLYSFINAFGLSVAIAFCCLTYLYIQDEKSFDRFHVNADQIYRMHITSFDEEKLKAGEKEPYSSHAFMPAALGERMLEELSEVQHMTRFQSWGEGTMRYNDKIFKQTFAYIDSGFFKMFSFPLVKGSLNKVFRNKTDAVITEEVATKYFGLEDPIGKTFTLETGGENHTMTVVAVIKAPPANSSLEFKMLVPVDLGRWIERSRQNWGSHSYPTFVQLNPQTSLPTFKEHLDTLVMKYAGENYKRWRERENIPAEFKVSETNFLPLADIHLNTKVSWEKGSDPKYSWILAGIGILILVIACINYISLALATSASRRKEVGVRKVMGAQNNQLAFQFEFESIFLSLISLIIGLGMVVLFLPAFNEFTGKGIELTIVNVRQGIGIGLLLAVVIGLLAGGYPSFFLSQYKPALVLKGSFGSKVQAGFTKPLVVLQFFISTSMIICAVIMYRQMEFISTKDLGYDTDQVICVEMQAGFSPQADRAVENFRNRLTKDPNVLSVAGTSSSFNKGWSRNGYIINGENKSAFVYRVDTDYITLLGIELVAGRNFDPARPSDSTAIIVNEALVKDMGWTNPLEEHLNWREDKEGLGSQVIGVVKDYHFLSLEQEIEPMFLSMDAEHVGYMTEALIKLSAGDLAGKVAKVEVAYKELFPDKQFVSSFVDEDVSRQYQSYQRWMGITGLSTLFAIIISSLGLFGLAGINTVNRTKEIGIRKILGANLSTIFVLLNRQYVLLATLSFILAAPVSWYVMNHWWLQSFQFKIDVGWDIYMVCWAIGLAVAMLTISYHAVKAVLTNPVETLKYE